MTSWWECAVGRSADLERVFTGADVAAYETLSGDTCPTGEVPEPLIAGLFSTLLGVDLPGPGTNYLKQAMEFVSTARVGERVRARVTITAVRREKRLVDLATTCTVGERTVCRGRALVLARGVSLDTSLTTDQTET